MSESLLTIENLHIQNENSGQRLLKQVNLEIAKGEIVALIGESGSGKSLTARALLNLLPDKMSTKGKIVFEKSNLEKMSQQERKRLLGKEIGIIFQDYRGSFTPFIKIGKQMVETIQSHYALSKKEAKRTSFDVLSEMGLDADRVLHSYPFQLSGGQIQRAAIATAIALRPSLLICDEVTTALDVMSGEKVLQYLHKVRQDTGCAILLITHDLTQAYKHTDRIYVMEKGEVVEEGLPEVIRCDHKHPYTKKLCSCLLTLPEEEKMVISQ